MGSITDTSSLSAALDTVRQAAALGDERVTAHLASFARELSADCEEPADYIHRIGYTALQQPVLAAIGSSRGIFKHVVTGQEKTTSLQSLVEASGLQEQLLTRLLRAMVTFGMLDSPSSGHYSANRRTHVLARDYADAALQHFLKNTGTGLLGIPRWIEAQAKSLPSKPTPYMLHNNTDLTSMQSMDIAGLSAYMRYCTPDNGLSAVWSNAYPVQEAIASRTGSTRPFFIDVAGGWGHQTSEMLLKFPDIDGRCIVQEISSVVEQATSLANGASKIEFKVQDFFSPQPSSEHGAKIYYLRYIMHDWSDDEDVQILSHLRDAMADDSVIIIDEVLVPEQASGFDDPWPATVDIVMLAMFYNARERTVKEFTHLAERVGGLKVQMAKQYDERRGNGIVVLAKA
ncbi:Demethylsterigmatocystin 6-O-methyltransferase [Cyphellophora attinorum]|uniref:Demethylsterigmatocystin 6-O-methyltransferase n=1 Tax=Cyphellophora attinorum TaxID=1664694 RepID=A0A0N1H3L3_9EURO|nr:Demethylsterigmatocystin 6-O-methyltransferase [Phialophora attinorum]KPI35463.1 Demethylsterigmatocystin 6-O-methyltransferase [Phialophora attinorum]